MRCTLDKKILCTLGPSSMNDKVIARLTELGVSLFRINLSHTKVEDLERLITYIQSQTTVPVCLDTEGAQIRTGELAETSVDVDENGIIRIPRYPVEGDSSEFNLYPNDVIDKLELGDLISIDFNSVLVQVVEKDSKAIVVRVLTGGTIGQNKAVSVDRDIPLSPLTAKDYEAMAVGKKLGIKHVALSFVNRKEDIEELRSVIGEDVFLISKIESRNGINNLEEITEKSNALLLDRGDLSRQLPIEQIPRAQKEVIEKVKQGGKKIYVATNLLESMIKVVTPTRAEVNDVFNTLNDGADGLVLAAETAIGSYPVECAKMVSKVINQYSGFKSDHKVLESTGDEYSFLLTEPHGGKLVDRVNNNPDFAAIQKYKVIDVDRHTILNAEQIGIGTFSPLEGFMTKKDVDSVLDDYRTSAGVIWPLPIVLQTNDEETSKLNAGETIALRLKNTEEIYATLSVEEVYTYDLDMMAQKVFGTNDTDHPGADNLKRRGNIFVGGKIELIRRLASPYKHYELTPRQARTIFENKTWTRIVGFHTRNVAHRVHEHIQMLAFEKFHCDGLFIHPVIGPKKQGDYTAEMIINSYKLLVEKYYPKGKVLLGAFQSYSRYAGPREAVFTALCRKNFGCSHFIVGRDHTGVKDYYKPNAAHELFESLGDIGIKPIFFNQVHYCQECKCYVEACQHDVDDMVHISGTKIREMLKAEKLPPDWFMREDISNFIVSEIKNGKEVFVK